MEVVELLVRMDCKGCEQKVRKQLSKLKGVESVEVDLRMNKVTVFGFANRKKVLKAARKTGKRAEFWQEAFSSLHNFSYHNSDEGIMNNFKGTQYSHNSSYNKSSLPLSSHIQPFRRTYNYEKHGYNNYEYSTLESTPYYPQHGSTSHTSSSMFSEEDPNSCSIM
ncbi:hypothetical protein L7F22_047940 [Adiantum nelumboides]|nr:hypothetical protein [Adiantum nelumboides]